MLIQLFREIYNNLFKKTNTKLDLLNHISFGSSIAEDEENLSNHFLETDVWEKIFSQKKDLVLGAKGSGKSAIYKMLQNKAEILLKKNILLINADNITGAPAFSDIQQNIRELRSNKPIDEEEFLNLWKLYFVQIITDHLYKNGLVSTEINRIITILKENNLSAADHEISFIEKVRKSIAYLSKLKEIEPSVSVDAAGSMSVNCKIVFSEVSDNTKIISINKLFEIINTYLDENNLTILISVDRLDAAFPANSTIEKFALRSLLKVYRDFKNYKKISLLIFLRDDIWNLITQDGFRELTHFDYETINWNKESLFNLFIKRLSENEFILKYFNIDKKTLFKNIETQNKLFLHIFPSKVNPGQKESKTFDWVMARLKDGNDNLQPRDLIHFANTLIQLTKDNISQGGLSNEIDNGSIVPREVFKKALEKVSQDRLQKNLYAEYPQFKEYIEALKDQKATQSLSTLASLWGMNEKESELVASNLVEIGFFKKILNLKEYTVPYFYCAATSLNIKNGKQQTSL